MTAERHVVVTEHGTRRAVAMDSITHANATHGPGDVLIGASFGGIVAVQFAARFRPHAVVVHDCGIGRDGAGISGLWFLDGAGIPALAVDSTTARIADGVDMWDRGVVSVVNHWATVLGVMAGMTVQDAVPLLFAWDGGEWTDDEPRERRVVLDEVAGHAVVAADSIRFAVPEDRDNVVCVGSHSGRTAAAYALEIGPVGFLGSDGGGGREGSGTSGLAVLAGAGIPAAAVSVDSARIGDGVSTHQDGVISHANEIARALGVHEGQSAREAAALMATAASASPVPTGSAGSGG